MRSAVRMDGGAWDAQGDMFMALVGATTAVVFLTRPQDRAISAVEGLSLPNGKG